MKNKKKWLRPLLFTAAGALIGLGIYYFIGCPSGTCAITSNPIGSMAYVALIGWLLSGIFGEECDSGCNM